MAAIVGNLHWLIYSREHNCFWRANSRGYCNLVQDAGRYSLQEATTICEHGRTVRHEDDPPEVMVVAPEVEEAFLELRRKYERLEMAARGALSRIESDIEANSYSVHEGDDLRKALGRNPADSASPETPTPTK